MERQNSNARIKVIKVSIESLSAMVMLSTECLIEETMSAILLRYEFEHRDVTILKPILAFSDYKDSISGTKMMNS